MSTKEDMSTESDKVRIPDVPEELDSTFYEVLKFRQYLVGALDITKTQMISAPIFDNPMRANNLLAHALNAMMDYIERYTNALKEYDKARKEYLKDK